MAPPTDDVARWPTFLVDHAGQLDRGQHRLVVLMLVLHDHPVDERALVDAFERELTHGGDVRTRFVR